MASFVNKKGMASVMIVLQLLASSVLGQLSAEEAQRKMLEAEGKAADTEKLSNIPDLTNYDTDTLRALAENLFMKVRRLEEELVKAERQIEIYRLRIERLGGGAGSYESNIERQKNQNQKEQDQAILIKESLPAAVEDGPSRHTAIDSPETSNSVSKFSEEFYDYHVRMEKHEDMTTCQVFFNSLPQTSNIASRIMRNIAEQAVKMNSSRDILVMAFDASGKTLPDIQYGGPLTYKASDGKIQTFLEMDNLIVIERDESTYFVRIEERRTAKGITPVQEAYWAYIVFPNKPTGLEGRTAVLKEIGKLKLRRNDIHLYIYLGVKSNKITWKQVKAPNGKFMAVDYLADTDEIRWNWD